MIPETNSSCMMECHSLTKRYANVKALDNITLSIPSGCIVGLLGPNGSGKTTLLKLAAGLLSPTAGSLTINGSIPGPRTKSIVSFLPDRSYFGSWMTTDQCLDFFSDFYADFDRQRAENMLGQLGIKANMRLKNMSKGTGEKLRLVLAMSRRARLYLLDEPIGGVDPAARDYILNTIIRNYSADSTVIISTHLIADIESILDEYIFIDCGHIIEFGTCDDVRKNAGKSLDEHFREVFKC